MGKVIIFWLWQGHKYDKAECTLVGGIIWNRQDPGDTFVHKIEGTCLLAEYKLRNCQYEELLEFSRGAGTG